MTRYLFGCACVCAVGIMPLVGCGETGGGGGSGGTAGDGGSGGTGAGGSGGTGAPVCLVSDVSLCNDENPCTDEFCEPENVCGHEPVNCSDGHDCTVEAACEPTFGCPAPTPVEDGTSCAGGTCQSSACLLSDSVLPCTEQGIRNAIAAGGAYTFDCDGPTTVTTEAEIVIDNDVVLDGGGNLTVDGNEDHRVFSVIAGVAAELHGLTITQGVTIAGSVFPGAGGILNRGDLILIDSIIRDDEVLFPRECDIYVSCNSDAGGVTNLGSLMLVNSVVSGNIGQCGIRNFGALTMDNSQVSQNVGDGIFNQFEAELTIANSAVSENTGHGVVNYGRLAITSSTVSGHPSTGIRNQGGGASIEMTNSTVSANTSPGEAGGVSNSDGANLTLENCTVSGNAAQTYGGGIHASAFGSLRIVSSTVAENTAPVGSALDQSSINDLEITDSLIDGDCAGPRGTHSLGNNIESPGNTCGFDQTGDQPGVTAEQLKLEPLADNGGPTMTHALLPGSVAIDVIAADACEVTEDQRGVLRPQGPACDVGAFELELAP